MTRHQKNIAIFAGGLGTRLKETEPLPKPLVDINRKTLIERVIEGIIKTEEFDRLILLICKDKYNNIYKEISRIYSNMIEIKIHQEQRRSGRTGAVRYIFENEPDLEESYFCNGDTIVKDVSRLKYHAYSKGQEKKPIVYLANIDATRNDYKEISIQEGCVKKKFQNSGYFLITRNWFRKAVDGRKDLETIDIDDLLFNKRNLNIYKELNSTIYDAGTPERLKLVRELFQ